MNHLQKGAINKTQNLFLSLLLFFKRHSAFHIFYLFSRFSSKKMCGGFRTDPHPRYFYPDSDLFCLGTSQIACRSLSPSPLKGLVISPVASLISKVFEKCISQNRSLRPRPVSREGQRNLTAFLTDGDYVFSAQSNLHAIINFFFWRIFFKPHQPRIRGVSI